MNGIKKTAKLLSGLEWDTVVQLLNHLDADTAVLLRREIMSIGKITLQESDKLAVEFLHAAGRKYCPNNGRQKNSSETIELASGTYNPISIRSPLPQTANRLALQTTNETTTINTNSNSNSYDHNQHNHTQTIHSATKNTELKNNTTDGNPFEFLFDIDSSEIAAVIFEEHPQTIAIVISHLPDSQAGEIIAKFATTTQRDIGHRVTDIKLSGFHLTNTPILFEIATEIKRRIDKNKNRIAFDELDQLDDTQLMTLFRNVDMTTAMFALVGANPRFIERITSKFTPAEEYLMRSSLKAAGMINETDIENARKILTEKVKSYRR
jgi:flagellar motor switch protein FliG